MWLKIATNCNKGICMEDKSRQNLSNHNIKLKGNQTPHEFTQCWDQKHRLLRVPLLAGLVVEWNGMDVGSCISALIKSSHFMKIQYFMVSLIFITFILWCEVAGGISVIYETSFVSVKIKCKTSKSLLVKYLFQGGKRKGRNVDPW